MQAGSGADLSSRTKSAYEMTSMMDAMSKVQTAVVQLKGSFPLSQLVELSSVAAVGRILAEDVLAPCDVPVLPCSRLDGYAVRAAHCTPGAEYAVHHRRRAGHTQPSPDTWPADSVCYITTGAPLPPGADSIVKVEDTLPVGYDEGEGGQVARVRVLPSAVVKAGEGVRPAASDVRAGSLLLPLGHVLTALDCATLLSARVTRVQCKAVLRVGVLSTGDELVDASSSASSRQDDDAVVDSNRPMLLSLLSTLDTRVQAVDLGRVGDTYEGTRAAIQEGAGKCDVLITTGAVSMGDRDYVKPALESCGSILFGRLNMKPGKPTTCALVGGKCLAFALPGNPVSVVVCFHMLVSPAIRALYGLPWPRALPPCVPVTVADIGGLQCDGERPEYHRAVVWWEEGAGQGAGGWYPGPGLPPTLPGGTLMAASTGGQASSRLASTTHANALLWLPAGGGNIAQGSRVAAYLTSPIKPAAAVPELMRTGHAQVGVDLHAQGCTCGREHPEEGSGSTRQAHVLHGVAATAAVPTPTGTVASSKAVVIQRLAVVTISDTAAGGKGADTAGPALVQALAALCPGLQAQEVITRVIPDDYRSIVSTLQELCDVSHAELILTTGGTGCGTRDVTPEATAHVIHKACPGIVHTMLTYSLGKTPMAALSRYSAGIRVWSDPALPQAGQALALPSIAGAGTLIINMPGSPKAVKECVEAIKVVLPHAVALATGK